MSTDRQKHDQYKYIKYKNKYLKLKREMVSGLNNKIKSNFDTYDGYKVPYHEEYIENIPDFLITKDPSKSSNKILVIDNIDSFDTFTKFYTKAAFDKKFMYVNWERVAQNFMGIYIDRSNKSLYLQRYEMHNYKDKDIFESWWKRELNNVNVIIFDKT